MSPHDHADLPYTIEGRTITCGTCTRTSHHPEDVYFRYCGWCKTFLGPAIRQKWNGSRAHLRDLVDCFGRYKKCRTFNGETCHAVPSEKIITEGLRGDEVEGYPLWDENTHGRGGAD